MEVTKIVINGIEITTLDKPIGLEANKLSLERDFQYSCIDTTIEAELKFYYASGKEQLDAEYESKGIEGSGYIEITENCGSNIQIFRFNLDFEKYNNQGTYTTVGLIDVNSLWKLDLNKEVNLTTGGGNLVDFYVRNLPLNYKYYSEKLSAQEKVEFSTSLPPEFLYNVDYPPVPSGDSHLSMYPKTYTTLNELEDGAELQSETMYFDKQETDLYIELPSTFDYRDFVGNPITPASWFYRISSLEPTPIFENTIEDGEITITTDGDSGVLITFYDFFDFNFEIFQMTEIVIIARDWDRWTPESVRGYIRQINNTNINFVNTNLTVPSSGLQLNYINAITPTVSQTKTMEIKKGEKMWIFYTIRTDDVSLGNIVFKTNNYQYDLNRTYDIDFRITKNVANSISTSADIIPYHTKTKAFLAQSAFNTIFGTTKNIGDTQCFEDLWFSRGDYLRNKINVSDFIVKPSDFFRELEKVVCCGLGYFYDTNPLGDKRLMSVYDFYSDNLVPIQYQFGFNDLIDGKIELAPFLSPYYKEVQVGYSNSKDTPKDFCKQNNYSINNISKNTYSKVSEFIASMFLITKALRLGGEDKELEFDNNIFILSGKNVTATPVNLNATLSQTSGFLADNIFTQPLNNAGINRRYATALNLFRHLYKLGFSLFADKDKLSVPKYEGNNIYDYEIRDTTGSSTNPYYHGLSICKLPLDNYVNVDRSIVDIYTEFIQSGLYVPTQITFKTANLSSLDLISMRAHQYDLFSVTDGENTYYGNLISANLEDDITEIKLLRRFKNGL